MSLKTFLISLFPKRPNLVDDGRPYDEALAEYLAGNCTEEA